MRRARGGPQGLASTGEALAGLLLALACACAPALAAQPRGPDLVRVEGLVVELTNGFRLSENRGPVKRDERLDAAARELAGVMAAKGKLAHDADGKRPWGRASDHGYTWCLIGENIAYRYMSRHFLAHELAEDFVRGWKDSEGHRKNMADVNMMHVGVAVTRSPATGGYYAVQLFGRPSRDC